MECQRKLVKKKEIIICSRKIQTFVGLVREIECLEGENSVKVRVNLMIRMSFRLFHDSTEKRSKD